MRTIALLDPSIASPNLGDQIIMDSVRKELHAIFPDSLFIHIQTQDKISKPSHKIINRSHHSFVGGTNLLSSNMNSYNQWKVGLLDALSISDIILMGVGWWQYQDNPNSFTRLLLRRLLHKSVLHSIRDSYTEQKLRAIGMDNVLNTGCPTMWSLTEEHCASIPTMKQSGVLVTFTEYNQDRASDLETLKLLGSQYSTIFYWPQNSEDYAYMEALRKDIPVAYISPSLPALDDFLKNNEVDYIGTRLHAGIRAIQHKKRSLVIAIDNRAREISQDTNLPVVARGDISSISAWIKSISSTNITLKTKNIDAWKSQFVRHG